MVVRVKDEFQVPCINGRWEYYYLESLFKQDITKNSNFGYNIN